MNILKSALGHYEAVGNAADADCVIGHSFGTLIGKGTANQDLADFILKNADGRPVIADAMLADSFPYGRSAVDFVAEGPISNLTASEGGSWNTLLFANSVMNNEGLSRPLMIAQAHHIGRVAMQAKKLGMESIVPENLPGTFDADSNQIWTRSLAMWVPREVLGSFVLKKQGKL